MFGSLASVASLILSTLLLMLGFGVASYEIQVRAVIEGWSTLDVAIISTGYTIGFTLSCIVTPKLVLRVGHVRAFAAVVTFLTVAILSCAIIVDWRAWAVFRFLSGFGISGCYLIIESWLNEKATNENRGSLFSIYMVTTMVGVIGGQYLVPLGDPAKAELFILSAILFALGLLPTVLSRAQSPAAISEARFNVPLLYRRSPVAVIGALLSGATSGAWLGLGGLYAQRIALSTTDGATLLAAVALGGALSQIPLGRASDRMDRRIVMVFCGVIGALASLAIALHTGYAFPVLLVLAFVMGIAMFPIYSLNVAHANDRAEAHEYVEVSGGMMILYGFGTISGPILAGLAMEHTGPSALFWFFAVLFAAYATYAGWRMMHREGIAGPDGKTGFEVMTSPRRSHEQGE